MTLQQLKYAIEIAEKNSMCEAAKSLFISQPTLSNAIKDLEKELDVVIFIRTNKGITVSSEGKKFLGYARQVVEQADLLEAEYLGKKPVKQKFSISTQHYSFVVNAFVNLIKANGFGKYDFTLKETRTYEIIDDVKYMRSELGFLYLNDFNEKVIMKLLNSSNLVFEELYVATPHVFVSRTNPIAKQKIVTMEELEDYPYFSFEQGDNNSFYFSEEILSTLEHSKSINVSDRATMLNLMAGLNGFTICTGILAEGLSGPDIVAVPLNVKDKIRVGCITNKNTNLSKLGEAYLKELKNIIVKL